MLFHTLYPRPEGLAPPSFLTPFLSAPVIPDVRVVIVGQDPYHGPGQAHGLSFSVPDGVAQPPSLRNMVKEVASDPNLGATAGKGGNLEKWAKQVGGLPFLSFFFFASRITSSPPLSSPLPPSLLSSPPPPPSPLPPLILLFPPQGVLLLNACLTVRHKKANSHAKIGWANFTDAAIRAVNMRRKGVVFLLWWVAGGKGEREREEREREEREKRERREREEREKREKERERERKRGRDR